MVSVLVSVWTPLPPKPLLHTQLELEARVGIEPSPSEKCSDQKELSTGTGAKNLLCRWVWGIGTARETRHCLERDSAKCALPKLAHSMNRLPAHYLKLRRWTSAVG